MLTSVRVLRLIRAPLAVLVVLGMAALIARELHLLDRQLIFFPSREIAATPGDLGLSFEEVRFQAADGVNLHGWFVPGPSETTLLWFHGNAGNIGDRVENIMLLNRHVGVSVFIFDYRGYGLSEGSPSERGMYLDAQAAIDYLNTRPGVIAERDLVLFGRSIGSAVAVEMGARHGYRGVILESPFTSVKAMARRTNPVLSRVMPVGLVVRSKLDSLGKISSVTSPVMVVHGDLDQTVPVEMGVALFQEANEPKRLYLIKGAGHNDTYLVGGQEYFEALKAFIDSPDK